MTVQIPPSGLATHTRVSTIEDWYNPAIQAVWRQALRVVPSANRRSWEFAALYLMLHETGMLRPEARGLGLGAGTERLIFAVADRVAHVRATDLYSSPEGWVGARTEDPQAHVMARAPWPVPEGRVDAEHCDMRALPYEDESWDFVWSTSSIEHIGGPEDFVQHFNEVERVLRPGGVYAVSSIITWGAESEPTPSTYYYHPEEWCDLVHRSALVPEAIFDATVPHSHGNKPKFAESMLTGIPALGDQFQMTSLYRGGLVDSVFTALLRKDRGATKVRPRVVGHAESRRWLSASAERLTSRMWKEWQAPRLNPKAGRAGHWQSLPLAFPGGAMEMEFAAIGGGQTVGLTEHTIERNAKGRVLASYAAGDRLRREVVRVEAGRSYLVWAQGDVAKDVPILRLRLPPETSGRNGAARGAGRRPIWKFWR